MPARWFALYVAMLLTALAALGVWGCFGLNRHLIVALDHSGDGVAQTAAKLNGQFGTIAETDKLLLALKSTTVHGDMVIAHEQKQLSTLDAQERDVFGDLRANLSGSQTVLANLAEASQAATVTLSSANDTIRNLQPMEDHATALEGDAEVAVTDLDILLKDQAIHETLGNLRDTSSHVEGVTLDLERVSDKLTNDFVAKKPWYRKVGPSLSDLWDYGALAARHIP